ncbi:MAG: uncharacterized protein KVP18_004600 [Porospora cf. gigantea A]|uniref:uncharacterized protein n=1 Tax=Porospora cf. gigantea A TaxID=2853593 RepID=UPI00355A49A6|nr:MAG: hypothetical protein KVP18_004600 [Porospora cf. gigantea A]
MTTLYVSNLTDKLSRDDLKANLYDLYVQYGEVSSIALMGGWANPRRRGQAWVGFGTAAHATNAMRLTNGIVFMSKPLKVDLAKRKAADEPGDPAVPTSERDS